MITETETASPELQECLTDLYQRLATEGANIAHLLAVADHWRRESNAEAARLARLYFGKQDGKKISIFDFVERVEDMSARLWGLKALLHGFDDDLADNRHFHGAHRLAEDVALEMERLSKAFSAEALADPLASTPDDALAPTLVRHAAALRAAEHAALMNVALCPSAAEEVTAKLRHLLANHKRAHGPNLWRTAPAPEIMAALDLHFGGGDEAETTARCEGRSRDATRLNAHQ